MADAVDITYVERIVALLNASTAGADANRDGLVNALDITKVERIVGLLDLPTTGADANGDSALNALDITKTGGNGRPSVKAATCWDQY